MKLVGNELINLNDSSIVLLENKSTSKGNQNKYYDLNNHLYIKEQFFYQGVYWKDSYVEYIVSRLSKMTDTLGIKIVHQKVVTLSNGKLACVSKDFCYNTDYEWISLGRLLNKLPIKELGKSYKVFTTLVNLVKDKCNIDITDYLIVMIVFDYLIGNEDRHYNNIGVLRNQVTGEFSIAPLFDFGLGLFEHDLRYRGKQLNNAILLMEGKPFHNDLSKPVSMLLNTCHRDKVVRIIKGIRILHKDLYPNELGYEYYVKALSNIKELIDET